MSIQVSIQMSVLSVFTTVQTVQMSSSFFQMLFEKGTTQKAQKKPQKAAL